jgi:hypothetical protein
MTAVLRRKEENGKKKLFRNNGATSGVLRKDVGSRDQCPYRAKTGSDGVEGICDFG